MKRGFLILYICSLSGRLRFEITGVRLPYLESGVVGKLLAFLWGSAELPQAIALRDLAYLLLPRESRSFPTTPFHVWKKRTPIPRRSFSHSSLLSMHKALCIKLLRCECQLWGDYIIHFPQSYKLIFPEVVSRIFHGKGAEGNGETPTLSVQATRSAAYGLD